METDAQKEKRLYQESRALKFQARELRKKRLASEAAVVASLKTAAEVKKREAKKDLDNRIRKALLAMADIVKVNGLAFESPNMMLGYKIDTKDAFILIDTKGHDPFTDPERIQIRTQYNGFQWD